MISGGLVTLERVRVILYRLAGERRGERWEHQAEGLRPRPGDE